MSAIRTEWFLEPLGPDVVDLIGGDAAISEKETSHRPSLELVLIRWGSSLATRVETVRVELVEESHDLSDPGLQQLLSRTHTIILLHPRAPRSCERCFQVEGRALRDRLLRARVTSDLLEDRRSGRCWLHRADSA